MTAEHYTFGDREHVALTLLPCVINHNERKEHAPLTRYVALGLPLVFWPRLPDPKNDWKGPRDSGWPTKAYTLSDYRDDMQVGVKLGTEIAAGKFLVDIDLDWAPGIRFLKHLLPATGFGFGRKSKPIGHAFYTTSAAVPYYKFADIDGTTIVERRGTKTDGSIGLQTVMPPSVHRATGEVLSLLADGDIGHDDTVIDGVTMYAVACLLGRHWPANGPDTNQHDTAAYAAGFLCLRGINPEHIPTIVEVAATLGGDSHVRDRVQYAIDTVAKFQAGEKVTGGPKLAREIGEDVVARLREWLPREDAAEDAIGEAVATLNKTTALIWQQSGSLVILTEDIEDEQPHLRFSRPGDMPLLYPELIQIGTKKNGDAILKALGSVWLTHPQRRFYRGIEVAPHGRGNEGYYNLWRGFSVEPKKGEWPLFREHLNLVAGGGEEHARYILTWLAETVQHPERPIGVALAFRGKPGTGKSTFAKWFGELFGVHFLHLDSEQHLLGRFNSHLHNTIVLLADEAVWAGSKAGLGALKRMITEDTLNIERKNIDILTVKNMIHMMIASNEKWVVPANFDDRRFAIFGTSVARLNDRTFFAAVSRELFEHGGLAALLYDLLEFKSDIILQQIPETTDRSEQKMLSATPEEKWWVEKLHQGALVPSWPEAGQLAKDTVHDDYIRFLERHHSGGRHSRATQTELGKFLKQRTPLRDSRSNSLIPGERAYVWIVPTLEECRDAWALANGLREDYEWAD